MENKTKQFLISEILDRHLPATGINTRRETLRMKLHRDFFELIERLEQKKEEKPIKIFHGGCVGCIVQQTYGIGNCSGCLYANGVMSGKPDLSIKNKINN